MASEDRPVAAYTVSMLGVVLQVVSIIFMTYMSFYAPFAGYSPMGPGMMMGPSMMGAFASGWGPFGALLGVVVIALGVVGVLWMNSVDITRVRTGATLVLIASIIALSTMFGFGIGALLMLVGGILGLTWQPSPKG